MTAHGDNGQWDLIVVGAGSAGAALAARVADAGRNVLLLEAGPDYRSEHMSEVWRSPNPVVALRDRGTWDDMLWGDVFARRTEAQEPALYWRGRGVGGSSAINGQIAIRPPREDFDDWAAAGCTGWDWESVLPYFNRLERDIEFGDQPYHGADGPIPIYRMPQEEWGSVDKALRDAALAYGLPWAEDVNAPGAIGVSPYPINSENQRRVTTNDAYLEPRRDLETLTIRGASMVDRVLFEGDRAIGVRVAVAQGSEVTYTDEFADEIIIAAGVTHSPGILMRSGIGPAEKLGALGIEVRADLPVGEGMQDHSIVGINIALKPEARIKTLDDRHTNCTVRFTSDDPDSVPYDLQIVATNQAVLAMEKAQMRIGAGAIGIWLNHSYSRGEVTIPSTDPFVPPIINERMLSDKRDLRRMRWAVRTLAELCDHESVEQISEGTLAEMNPDLYAALGAGDAELDAYILSKAADTQHGTSTCRMGASANGEAVVDPDCRVFGVQGLRVVDASIFPTVSRANTHLAAVMVGERMADRLIEGSAA